MQRDSMWRNVPRMATQIEYELSPGEALALDRISGDTVAAAGPWQPPQWGAPLGTRFTKVQSALTTVEMPQDDRFARQHAIEAIERFGSVIPDPNGTKGGPVWGVIPSGLMDMVAALVRVDIKPSVNGSTAKVLAIGREGLITQRIGAKAADRVGSAMLV